MVVNERMAASITGMESAPNLVLVGPMGAGKTSIGRRIAELHGLAFVDADREIETRTGAPVATIFDCEGEAGFRERERAVLVELLDADGAVIATGGGAVLDPGTRRLLRERGFVVHLHVSVDQQLRRLARDSTRPLIAGDDREAVLLRLAREREPLYADAADLRFETGTSGPAEAALRLREVLESHWPRLSSGSPLP
jgi:shikimate kinase